MKEFYKGVIIGVILKETFSKLLKKLVFNTINTVYSGLKFLYYRNILKYL